MCCAAGNCHLTLPFPCFCFVRYLQLQCSVNDGTVISSFKAWHKGLECCGIVAGVIAKSRLFGEMLVASCCSSVWSLSFPSPLHLEILDVCIEFPGLHLPLQSGSESPWLQAASRVAPIGKDFCQFPCCRKVNKGKILHSLRNSHSCGPDRSIRSVNY